MHCPPWDSRTKCAVISFTTSTTAEEDVDEDPVLTRHQQKLDYVKTIVQESDKLVKEGYTVDRVARLLWTGEELDELLRRTS